MSERTYHSKTQGNENEEKSGLQTIIDEEAGGAFDEEHKAAIAELKGADEDIEVEGSVSLSVASAEVQMMDNMSEAFGPDKEGGQEDIVRPHFQTRAEAILDKI